ncbi:MAG: hypothetical protein GQ569_09895, partial [Methylococcaceae bacterium]|nr:hypothetical protein [Methylococcaceae bacterium]
SLEHWQARLELVKDYAGADSYYSPERDVYSKGFRGTPERPVKLSLLGSRTLRFKIRPLHPEGVLDSALNGWIEIKDNVGTNLTGLKDLSGLNSQHRLYPFTNNTPSQGLNLVSGKALQLGGLVELEYQLGEGWHDIEIFSQQANISISVEELQAQMPVTVLPRLTPYNFEAHWLLPELPMLTVSNQTLINPFRNTNFPSAAKGSQPINLIRQAISIGESIISHRQVETPFTPLVKTADAACLSARIENNIEMLKRLPRTQSSSLTISAKTLTVAEVLNLIQIETIEQAQLRMMQYLRLVEQDAANIEKLLFPAEKLRLTYLYDPLLQSLWQRISRYSQWQPLESIEANAGLRFIEIEGWQPESPFIRTRKALLPYIAKQEHIIFADQRLVFISQNLKPISLHIAARLSDVPFLPESDAQLLFSIDDNPPQTVTLKREQSWQRFTVNLPEGEHSLRFYQPKSLGNQYIKLRFDDHISDLTVSQERGYFVSTHNEAVKINVQGETLLRIDEWQNGSSKTHYVEVAEGWQSLRFPPTKGQSERLLRFKQRRLVFEPKEINSRIIQRTLEKIPEPALKLSEAKKISKVHLHDEFKLGAQEDGTTTLGFDLVRRNNAQEDTDSKQAEQFAQYRLEHHYYQPYFKTYTHIQALGRVREFGGTTLGLKYSQFFLPSLLPFSVTVDSKLMGQWVHDEFEWLGEIKLKASKSYQILPKTKLIPSVSTFARHLSLKGDRRTSEDEQFQQKIDQDVYSPYKADHTSGLNASLLVEHRPWLDTLWTGKVKLGSNEAFDWFELDHISTEFHWKQLLGEVKLDASYKMTFYQADKDRVKSSKRSRFDLDIEWNHWLWHQQRFQFETNYSYDIENKENLIMFSVSVHLSEGRGYRDFKPSSLDFKHLMQRQIPDEENN